MPPGGGGMPPFPHGGAEQAPPTPDGRPPEYAAGGKFITSAGRNLRDMFLMGADDAAKAARELPAAADAAAGRLTMVPQPTPARLENVRGAGGRYTKDQYVTGGDLRYPSLTEGIKAGVQDMWSNPALRSAVIAGGAGAGAALTPEAILQANQYLNGDPTKSAQPSTMADVNGVPVEVDPYWGYLGPRGPEMEPLAELPPKAPFDVVKPQDMDAGATTPPTGTPKTAADMLKDIGPSAAMEDYIARSQIAEEKQQSGKVIADMIKAAAKPSKTKAERIREATKENVALYNEILGDGAQDRKTQALLLLAEAGFKFAGNAKPTMAMALADSLSGVTKGLSALAAQKSERDMKIKTLALSGAAEQVATEDEYAAAAASDNRKFMRDLYVEQVKANNERQNKILEYDLKNMGGGKLKEGAAGLRRRELPNGSFGGYAIEPTDPTVQGAINSPMTLNEANPFVVNQGSAVSAMETDDATRNKVVTQLNSKANMANAIDDLIPAIGASYGPNAWFWNKYNNVLAPMPGFDPNVKNAEMATKIDSLIGRVRTMAAKAADDGRLSNQEQEWVNQYLPADANSFWADPQTNMKKLATLSTMFKNARQDDLARLGYVKTQLGMDVPPLGTQNDPYTMPVDKAEEVKLLGFLADSFKDHPDKNALLYFRQANGSIRPMKISDIAK